MLVLVTLVSAQAQVSGGDVPELNAQTFRPTVDGRRLFWLDDGAKGRKGFTARGLFQYVDDPLVYLDTEDELQELVSSIVQFDLLAAGRIGPLRIGVDVPVYLLSNGEPNGNETGLGDIAADGKLTLLDKAVDLAVGGRLFLPTSTVATALGNPDLGYEVSAIISGDAGPVLLAANVGTRGGPATSLENIELNDAFIARVGAALQITDAFDTAVEFSGQLPYTAPLDTFDGSPIEFLASAALRPGNGDWVLRAGGGSGLTPGIGSPDYRIVLGFGFERADEDEIEEPPPVVDLCPDEEEDFDGYEDDDGCPEPTVVFVEVIDDSTGQVLDVAKVTVKNDRKEARGTTPFEQPFRTGEVTISAKARGYEPATMTYLVPEGQPVTAQIRLQPSDEQTVIVERKKLTLNDTIQFETNKAVIKPESYAMLNETADAINEYGEIKALRIEGHTDERGSDAYNLDLSKQRAAALVEYFIERGVDPARLSSEGFGETRPIDNRSTPEAWAKNRRVDFFIEEWKSVPIEVKITEVPEDFVPIDEEQQRKLDEATKGSEE